MSNFSVRVLHLGIIIMEVNKTAVHIQERIASILGSFGLSMEQIYKISVGNGSNVVRCSKNIL